MGLEAATKALLDAGNNVGYHFYNMHTQPATGITYDSIESAYVGYCYGDSTSGQVPLIYIISKYCTTDPSSARPVQLGIDRYPNHQRQ
jgi:hypothetical protein